MGNKIKNKCFRKISQYSGMMFVVLAVLIIFPLTRLDDNTQATITPSTTTLTLSTADISTEITPSSTSGTFVASDPATISVVTNNYSGYTLGISASDNVNNTKLINTNDNTAYLNSISSASSAEEFNANNWGYLPSKLNSQANTSYQPAPTTTATTLDATNTANAEANTYTIALGAKADYSLPSGTYENSFTLTAVANPVAYTITYNKNTEDEVTNMPANQSGSIEDTDITIPNTTPTREHYAFQGWCNVTPATDNGVDSCSGTTYQPGDTVDMNKTAENNTILHALWKVDTFTQTTEVRYEVANADGTYGSYTTVDTQEVPRGSTYSWSTSQISGFDTATYNSASVTAYTVTEAHTNQVNITRKSYVLTVNRNTSYISSVSGAGTYKVGKVVSISATASSGNKFTSWSQTAGTTSSFGSTSSASTTFTMPASAATIYANGETLPEAGTFERAYYDASKSKITIDGSQYYKMQDMNSSICASITTGKTSQLVDIRDNKVYQVKKIPNGNGFCIMYDHLNIAGGTTLNPTTSNVTRNYTLPTSNISGFSDDTISSVYNDTSRGIGFYNYAAFTAGTNPSSGDAAQDICPANWKVPTASEAGTDKNDLSNFSLISIMYVNGSQTEHTAPPCNQGPPERCVYLATSTAATSTTFTVAMRNQAYFVGRNLTKRIGLAVSCVAKK